MASPLRTAAPCGPSAHRLGDCAGRSPGSRVNACHPAFPVSQWLTRTTGSPLTVAEAATAAATRIHSVGRVRVPYCLPGSHRGTSTPPSFLCTLSNSQGSAARIGRVVAPLQQRHLPLRLVEMPQVGRRLARSARLQLAVDPDVIGLAFDEDIVVVLGAAVLDPVWV